jgi:hypothetical protein|tara:strand:- start:2584 stop:3141 length:558 start_codon:yes stop_codon:yes gene_type:complete
MSYQYVLKNQGGRYGGVSVNESAVEFIKTILDEGKTILELGSGPGSTVGLGKIYKLYSVENQPEWCDKFREYTTYINCRSKSYNKVYTKPDGFPNDQAWYDPDDLFPNLPINYDLILVDGPGGYSHGWGRGGFFKHIGEFNTNVPIIFDDVNDPEKGGILMRKISEYTNRPFKILDTDKATGYIL